MPTKNFSSVGGYAVGSKEVLNTSYELKNISSMHMTSDNFTDANHDIYILKRQTDAANNTLQLTLDGTTALATNTPALAADRVAFVKARVFGQETTTNTYVYATTFDIVVTVSATGVPTVALHMKILLLRIHQDKKIGVLLQTLFKLEDPHISLLKLNQ